MLNCYNERALSDLLTGSVIDPRMGSRIFDPLMRGETPDSQIKSLLVLFAERGETTSDLFCAWKSIRSVEKNSVVTLPNALDTCGTGGDRSQSINLSTLSSFVMAAAGVRVVKHGNRALTSLCGSSDLLAAFGMNLNQSISSVIQSAKKIGMGYFHAPHVHPVYARFQGLRKSIHTRTLFNLLGPVLNPIAVEYQVLGIAQSVLLKTYAELLPKLGRKAALIVQGAQGMDEVTSLGISRGLELNGSQAKAWSLNPTQFGFKTGRLSELQIRSVPHAKKVAVETLKQRKQGTASDSVVLSAACGIWIAGYSESLKDAVTQAHFALHSGKAWNLLNQLIQYSKK